jgi:hypothetical protein
VKDKAYQSLNLTHQDTINLVFFNGDVRKEQRAEECCSMAGPYLLLFPRDCELFICINLVRLAIASILDS